MFNKSKKLYYIADWKDEYCDLTLDEMFEKIGGNVGEVNNESVKTFIDKIKAQYNIETMCFMKKQVKEIKEYIEKNKNKDLIIHCEYGKSRSVAIGIFLRDNLNYRIINKEEKELIKYNDWVLLMLKKFY